MGELRAVFDGNVIVSAVLLPRSVPRQAFDLALERGKILLSGPVVEELDAVLRRPRFDRYVPEEQRLEFLGALVREGILIDVTATVAECRNTNDNKYL